MKKTDMNLAYKLVHIAQRRRRGDIATLSAATDFTPGYVSLVLSGQRNNEDIVERAYSLTRNRPTVQEEFGC